LSPIKELKIAISTMYHLKLMIFKLLLHNFKVKLRYISPMEMLQLIFMMELLNLCLILTSGEV
jgi:hypothetical protein